MTICGLDILKSIGLFGESIDNAYDKACEALEKVYLEDKQDDLEDELNEQVSHYFSWEEPTNSIIKAIFEITEDIIHNEYPNIEITKYINGYDSSFIIYDFDFKIDIFEELKKRHIDKDLIKRIVKESLYEKSSLEIDQLAEIALDGEETLNDFIEIYKKGNDIVIYEDVEALGENAKDNGCRDKDDTDESFGQFLIRSYKDGNSDTFYFEFTNGEVIAGDYR